MLADGCERGLVGLVARHEAGDCGPELWCVVSLTEVGEFVDKDVVDEARWQLQCGPVEVDALRALSRTG